MRRFNIWCKLNSVRSSLNRKIFSCSQVVKTNKMSCQLFTCWSVSIILLENVWNMKIWGFSSLLMTVNEDLSHLTFTHLHVCKSEHVLILWWDRCCLSCRITKELFLFLPPTRSFAVKDQKLAADANDWRVDWFEDCVTVASWFNISKVWRLDVLRSHQLYTEMNKSHVHDQRFQLKY